MQLVVWPLSIGSFVSGLVLGGLGALNALGLALIWRSNRVVNLSQAELGTVPATLVLLMMEVWKLPLVAGLPIGLAAAVVTGAVVELLVVRRFARASRLVLLVVTIGIAQALAVAAVLLPGAFDRIPADRSFEPPTDWRWTIGQVVFSVNDLIGAVAVVVALAALAWFLLRTDVGVAVRASAERADRAGMLGIPVGRLQTGVWVVAAVLSFLATFLTAGITSLPPGYAATLNIVLRALAALVMGGMTNLGAVTASAIVLGLLESGIVTRHGDANLVAPLLALVILLVLLGRRRSVTRVERDATASWRDLNEVRPIPRQLARLGVVRAVRWGGGAVVLALVAALPTVTGTGTTLKAAAILVFATIGVSIVVLSGWAGQVSLGQMTLVGVGAAVTTWATVDRGVDPIVALAAAGVAGSVVAVVIGLPALRLRGLYLAVTTLAVALAASAALFSNAYLDWIPRGAFPRPTLLDRLSLDSATRVYLLALVVLLLALLAVGGLRRSRTGRVLIALRDNEAAAAAYGISVTRAKLTAFAASGFLAALAGGVFAYVQASFQPSNFTAAESIRVFSAAVIGGLASPLGAVLGAVYARGTQYLLPGSWQLLATSIGVLLVLMVIPDGLGGLAFRLRDAALRWLAVRRGIEAPSLVGVEESAELDDAGEAAA